MLRDETLACLELLVETLACLELLVEIRLALSSPITVEARVSTLEDEALEELEESSVLAHDANIKGKNIRVKNSNLNFVTSFFAKLSERTKKVRLGALEVI